MALRIDGIKYSTVGIIQIIFNSSLKCIKIAAELIENYLATASIKLCHIIIK